MEQLWNIFGAADFLLVAISVKNQFCTLYNVVQCKDANTANMRP